MADNDENENAMQEIILPIRQDGVKTRNHGGSTHPSISDSQTHKKNPIPTTMHRNRI